MKDALTVRAEFTLQTKEQDFITAIDSLVKNQIDSIKELIPEEILESLDIEQVIISDIQKKINQKLTQLPEKFFDFGADIQQNTSSQREKIGKKAIIRSRKVGGCVKKMETYTEMVDEYGNVKYQQLFLPNINTMAKQWASEIENSKSGKGGLWDIL